MTDTLLDRNDLEFYLYDLLKVDSLCKATRFQEHSRETFNAALDTAEQIAKAKFANHNRLADEHEPTFDGDKVSMRAEIKEAFDAIAEAGFIAAREDYQDGGMQLPEVILSACMGFFTAANPSTVAYPFLTTAAARLINEFACESLKSQFLPPMRTGRYSGTMALTEPHAGSSLADIRSKAILHEGGHYNIKGQKIFISGGDHELTENIVHLVLAKIEGAPSGVKGISLFLVPKYLLDAKGRPSQRNDVSLTGLFHKLGYRGTTSTALNFGEHDNCVGYLIGEPHQGLKYMFQMMNEARLGVGMGAACIGYRGYQHALAYAKERPQGRSPSNNDPSSAPINIIEHADVKRMLLAQKAYSEGALSLCLYGARLIDDANVASGEAQKEAKILLDLLTPILKAWPSEYGTKANDLAIQVLGGAGYTREYDVEQCWRDNRLNPIHEGTNGIQSLDLLGRKVWQHNGLGLQILGKYITKDLAACHDHIKPWAGHLTLLLKDISEITRLISKEIQTAGPDQALTNSAAYLHLLGHTVVAWLWLKQANIAIDLKSNTKDQNLAAFYDGKIQAATYFFNFELPLLARDIQVLKTMDTTCFDIQPENF